MKIFKRLSILIPLLFALIISYFAGCKKFIDVGAPVTSTNADNAYSSDATAISVLNGIYAKMSLGNSTAILQNTISGISILPGLSSDELTLYEINDADLLSFYKNDLTSNTDIGIYWNFLYNQIFTCNSAIEGIKSSDKITPVVSKQLLGEALFMRAFSHFYLVALYGDVPLVTQTDPLVNSSLHKTEQSKVYEQIVADLNEAKKLLSGKYLKSDLLTAYPVANTERVRPTKWAACALLARVYLYMEDFANAEIESTEVINKSDYFQLDPLDIAFAKNSGETLWSLQPVNIGEVSNTGEGALFILPSTGPNGNYPVYLSTALLYSFEPLDLRLIAWVDSVKPESQAYYYAKKYRIGRGNPEVKEYSIVLRLGEQLLIRAEARANQNNIDGAQADLNQIRNRAGLPNTLANTKDALLDAILHERQVELFTEWGHRWFDLKRTGKINDVMSVFTSVKGGTWLPYKSLYPIPQLEINANINLTQNDGY